VTHFIRKSFSVHVGQSYSEDFAKRWEETFGRKSNELEEGEEIHRAAFAKDVTPTGRTSSEPGLQQLSPRTELGQQIRDSFVRAQETHLGECIECGKKDIPINSEGWCFRCFERV